MSAERTYELTVAGTLGPVLRGALGTSSIATVEITTLRFEESAGCDLSDVITLLDGAGLRVEAVYRTGLV